MKNASPVPFPTSLVVKTVQNPQTVCLANPRTGTENGYTYLRPCFCGDKNLDKIGTRTFFAVASKAHWVLLQGQL